MANIHFNILKVPMRNNNSSTASWAKDKVGDLLSKLHHCTIPGSQVQHLARGEILTPSQARELGSAGPIRDDVSVVQAFYKTRAIAEPSDSLNHTSYGQIPWRNAVLLTVRMQRGSSQFINLLNPADPQVYRLMHGWNSAGTMGLSLCDGNNVLFGYAPFRLQPRIAETLNECRGDPTYLHRFQTALSEVVGSGILLQTATSDIAAIRKLKEVQLALIATAHTTPGSDAFEVQG